MLKKLVEKITRRKRNSPEDISTQNGAAASLEMDWVFYWGFDMFKVLPTELICSEIFVYLPISFLLLEISTVSKSIKAEYIENDITWIVYKSTIFPEEKTIRNLKDFKKVFIENVFLNAKFVENKSGNISYSLLDKGRTVEKIASGWDAIYFYDEFKKNRVYVFELWSKMSFYSSPNVIFGIDCNFDSEKSGKTADVENNKNVYCVRYIFKEAGKFNGERVDVRNVGSISKSSVFGFCVDFKRMVFSFFRDGKLEHVFNKVKKEDLDIAKAFICPNNPKDRYTIRVGRKNLKYYDKYRKKK